MFRRNKIYSINRKAANEALQNVFAACEQTPNTQSLDVLLFKNIANTTLVKTGKWLSVSLFALVLMSPLAFYLAGRQESGRIGRGDITVTEHHIDADDQCFVMTLSGTNIDYEGIYAKKEDGSVIYPVSTDPDGTVKFHFESGTLNIYIPDTEGGIVQAVLSK